MLSVTPIDKSVVLSRKFLTSMPCIVIYHSGALIRVMQFSEIDNQPVITTAKEFFDLANPIETESGETVIFPRGIKLNHTVSFQIWDDSYLYGNSQITERELSVLHWARLNAQTTQVLFYPHRELYHPDDAPDMDYSVIIQEADATRSTIAQDRVEGTLIMRSRYIITDMLKFRWV